MRAIIIHGTMGYPGENWFPWLGTELEKLGWDVKIPAFPTPENQNLIAWQQAFTQQISTLTTDTILIAHSSDYAFALRLLQNSPAPIAGCYLVAGFHQRLGIPEFDPLHETFLAQPFAFERIAKNVKHLHVYASDNDPYVPEIYTEDLCKNLQAQWHLIIDAGHFNEAAGYFCFPQLFKDIQNDFAN